MLYEIKGGESEQNGVKLFNRSVPDKTTSSTADDYYQNDQREHKVVAWLLAFVTFVVTLLVVLLLFFAGRWVYQKLTKNDNQTTDTTQPQGDTGTSTPDIDGNLPGGSSATNDSAQTNGAQSNTDTNEPQTSSTSTSTPSQATGQPNTGPSQEELVRTGPDIDL